MVSKENLRVILNNLKRVLDNRIEGDIVELGCHIGTTSLFIQRILEYYKSDKKFHVYDSFKGLPRKHQKDYSNNVIRQFSEGDAKTFKIYLINSFGEAGLTLPAIHAGWFKDQEYPNKIAFAFFDGDFYTSIMDSFEKVYPKLTAGGIICVHDHKWDVFPGVEKACDEFLKNKPEEGTMVSNQGVGVLIKKGKTKKRQKNEKGN
jgi:O-methyltransferase